MTYQWKLPGLYSVPAQTAGDELSRIYAERGELQAADVVEESRPEAAPLHACFEWDDFKAAERYRQQQARTLIDCVVTVKKTKNSTMETVRAFPHTASSYHPIQVVLGKREMRDSLIQDALRDLEAFRKRLETFSTLEPVNHLRSCVDRAVQQLGQEATL